jgi:hypothetical protein
MQAYRLLTGGRGLWSVLAVAGLAVCAGCGSEGYSGPTGTVTGTVMLGGEPVPAGCTVTFISAEGFTATGSVQSGGSYKLTRVGNAGEVLETIPVGTYQVSIIPPPAAEMSEADYDKLMEAQAAGQEQANAGPADAIPSKYHTTQTSDLTEEVQEGANTINFELE